MRLQVTSNFKGVHRYVHNPNMDPDMDYFQVLWTVGVSYDNIILL